LASSDRGTKREDPETGKKFYDLNKDPIVSPYTGKTYPRSYFEATVKGRAVPERAVEEEEEVEVEVEEVVADAAAPEIVSLDEAEAEETAEEEIPEVEGVEEAEDIGEDEADVFLEEDEEEENLDFDVGTDER
jgi:uncharacterized protein (TIGR02300 family)